MVLPKRLRTDNDNESKTITKTLPINVTIMKTITIAKTITVTNGVYNDNDKDTCNGGTIFQAIMITITISINETIMITITIRMAKPISATVYTTITIRIDVMKTIRCL